MTDENETRRLARLINRHDVLVGNHDDVLDRCLRLCFLLFSFWILRWYLSWALLLSGFLDGRCLCLLVLLLLGTSKGCFFLGHQVNDLLLHFYLWLCAARPVIALFSLSLRVLIKSGSLIQVVYFLDHGCRQGAHRIVCEDEHSLFLGGHTALARWVASIAWNVVHDEERRGLALVYELRIRFLLSLLLFSIELGLTLLLFLLGTTCHKANWRVIVIIHDSLLYLGLELLDGSRCKWVAGSRLCCERVSTCGRGKRICGSGIASSGSGCRWVELCRSLCRVKSIRRELLVSSAPWCLLLLLRVTTILLLLLLRREALWSSPLLLLLLLLLAKAASWECVFIVDVIALALEHVVEVRHFLSN